VTLTVGGVIVIAVVVRSEVALRDDAAGEVHVGRVEARI
jgi:hypothetical protein